MNIKLVIVDDAPFIREIVKQIAVNHNIQVVQEVASGSDAVEAILAADTDVVLLDLALPGKNGVEIAHEVLKVKPHLPIIACSSIDDQNVIDQAIKVGCCEFVAKPFTVVALVNAIRAVAASSQAASGVEL